MVKEYSEDTFQANTIAENPKYFWQRAADEIQGDFELSPFKSNIKGINESFKLKITKKIQGINIELSSMFRTISLGKDKYLIGDLKLRSTVINQLDFHLFIWKKKQLKKLFSWNKQISGFRDFDRLVEFRTNRELEVQVFLSTKEMRDFFCQQNEILFKVQYEDKLLKINYQAKEIVCKTEDLLYEYFNYESLLEGLINAGLINQGLLK